MSNQYNSFQYNQIPASQQYQFIPQPQGLLYSINKSSEINNIPIGSTTIITLCLPENVCQIRTLQNGAPHITSYKLTPLSEEKEKEEIDIMDLINNINERLKNLEKTSKKGGSLDEFL